MPHSSHCSFCLLAATGVSRGKVQHTSCLHAGMLELGDCRKKCFWWQFRFLLHESTHFVTVNDVWNELYCLQQEPRQLIYLVTQREKAKCDESWSQCTEQLPPTKMKQSVFKYLHGRLVRQCGLINFFSTSFFTATL